MALIAKFGHHVVLVVHLLLLLLRLLLLMVMMLLLLMLLLMSNLNALIDSGAFSREQRRGRCGRSRASADQIQNACLFRSKMKEKTNELSQVKNARLRRETLNDFFIF